MLTDNVTRIAVIWSSNAVFWEAMGQLVAVSAGVNQYQMLLCGYVGVALMMTVGRDVAERAMSGSSNEMFKLGVEDAYVGISAAVGIMLWQGISRLSYTAASVVIQ